MGVADELRDPAGLALAAGAAVAASGTGLSAVAGAGVAVVVLAAKVVTGVWLDRRDQADGAALRPRGHPAAVVPDPEDVPPPEQPSAPLNVFCPEGEYWTVAYRGAMFRLKDAKGLRHLHRLLAAPGRELHVADLAGTLGERPGRAAALAEDGLSLAAGSDAGAVLDADAKAAYRRRLEDLDAELEEAQAWGDAERAARAEDEIAALANELARAVGLHGADRKAASATERARVNVTRAVKAAIERIAEHDRALGHHLASSVRTGTFCSYQPDPDDPPSWQL